MEQLEREEQAEVEVETQADADYHGLPGRTQQEPVHYCCTQCGALFGAVVHTAINVASDPELGESLSKGELNVLECPRCATRQVPNVALVYHDPNARCFALLLPEALRHEELRRRAELLQALDGDPCDIPEYVRQATVVFGTAGLLRLLDETMEALTPPEAAQQELERVRRSLDGRAEELERRAGELVGREEDLQAREDDLVAQRARLEQSERELAAGWADIERERSALRALALELQAARIEPAAPPDEEEQATVGGEPAAAQPADAAEPGEDVPPPTAAEQQPEERPVEAIERWRESGAAQGLALSEQRIVLLARDDDPQGALAVAEPELLVQLVEQPRGPFVALVLLPGGELEPGDAESQALWWALNPEDDVHDEILQRLGQEMVLQLELYADGAQPQKVWELRVPRAENLRLALKRYQTLRQQQDGEPDIAAATEAWRAMEPAERLGRKQHNFNATSFRELRTPAATRLAVGIVGYWSEPENERYLLLTKSFPLTYWRAIRERVVRKALEVGLHLGPQLAAFAVDRRLAKGEKELLLTSVANFAEVSLRIKPCDLEPGQEMENWRELLAACVREGITVDVEIEELAAAAARRAGVVDDETAAGGDLSLLELDDLLQLLGDRAQRRDAALELCDRGASDQVAALWDAVCTMTRSEVARVIPAMLPLGAPVVPHFVRGLQHRKSFLRQGCALALGAAKANEAIAPLVELLLAEPTNVWREAARALGQMGTLALGGLIAAVKETEGQGRERIAWALARAALQPGCAPEVQAMADGRDTRLARVATRAMELVPQVAEHEQELRRGSSAKEQTIVRSFTRQFFDAMRAEVSELSEADILDQEEVLDDGDIVDETVEVSEEDIIARVPEA